jgi:hypothetical protein
MANGRLPIADDRSPLANANRASLCFLRRHGFAAEFHWMNALRHEFDDDPVQNASSIDEETSTQVKQSLICLLVSLFTIFVQHA